MSNKIQQLHLSKNGGKQYYLQFHIKPWMNSILPHQYRNRKNLKKSLKTSILHEALKRMEIELKTLGLTMDEQTQEIIPDPAKFIPANEVTNLTPLTIEQEYHKARMDSAKWSDEDIEKTLEITDEVFTDQIEEMFNFDPEKARQSSKAHQARLDGYVRTLSGEDNKYDPAPHKYQISFKSAAEMLMEEMSEDSISKKRIGRVKNATNKFLSFLEVSDLLTEKITRKHVTAYIRESKRKAIPLNTFSAEFGALDRVFKFAQNEGYISARTPNPFDGHRPLDGFKDETKKAIYTQEQAEILAEAALNQLRYDILTTVAVSYYTGMRSSELFDCKLMDEDGTLYLDIRDGKTRSSIRHVPLHDHLKSWLIRNKLMPETGKGFDWSAPSSDAFNKRFNRFSEEILIKKHGFTEDNGTLSHHSFRHGMATRLYALGYDELQVAHVLGHSVATVARTTSGKIYIAKGQIEEIALRINKLTPIKLPDIPPKAKSIKL